MPMPPKRKRVLRNLSISEVSSVDKGAGEGTQVVLMKRLYSEEQFRRIFKVRDRSRGRPFYPPVYYAKARPDDDDDDDQQRIDVSDLTDDDIADIARLRMHKQQKENQMPETFAKMVSDIGIVRVAKAIVDRGHSSAISEEEFTKAVTDFAVRDARAGESRPQAFSRIFCADDETGIALRKACQIIKNAPMMVLVEPTQVGGDAVRSAASSGTGDAYEALMAKAAELRQREPGLTEAQAFAKAFSDPNNRGLVAAEREQNRPRA